MERVKCLLRNIYERTGSFEVPSDSKFKTILDNYLEKTNLSLDEFGYRCLGYSDHNAIEVKEARRLYLSGKKQEALKITHCNSEEEFEKRTNFNIHQTSIKPRKHECFGGFKDLDLLVAEYYSREATLLVLDDNTLVPLGLFLLKTKSSIKKLLEDPRIQKLLVSFDVAKDCSPSIYNGVLYTSRSLTEKQQQQINYKALQYAMRRTSPLKRWSNIPFVDLLLSSYKSPELYLSIMDYAHVVGKTYLEVVRDLGMNLPDLLQQYESISMIFYDLEDFVLYFDFKNATWVKIAVPMFLPMLEKHYNELNEDPMTGIQRVLEVDELNELHCF